MSRRNWMGVCGTILAVTGCSLSGSGGALDLGTADSGEDGGPSDGGGTSPSDGRSSSRGTPDCWRALPDLPPSTGPSGKMGACSMVGTWDYDVTFSDPGYPKMVWSFDDEGRAIGSPQGANLCAGFMWTANYTLGNGSFGVSKVRGQGAPSCGTSGSTTFDVELSSDCRTATLTIRGDSCTGGGLFYTGKMRRVD